MSNINQNIDQLSINTIRLLCADMVEEAGSGHPGAPMGCAPIAHLLFSKYMNYNGANPKWINRDRFVLSNGHACALHYAMLHLTGGDLTLSDLKNLRKIGSKTPGHPENCITKGIEVTTGPLGQGIANSVGIALAEAHLAATFNTQDFKVLDNYIYCILGDGCMMEGISSEACSLAGRLKLGNLIAIYDDNKVSIDGSTDLAFDEDVESRFKSYKWHVLTVKDGDNDIQSLSKAFEEAKNVKDKPTLIIVKTTIGYGAEKAGSADVHSNAFGKDSLAKVKEKLGFDPNVNFNIPKEVSEFWEQVQEKAKKKESDWDEMIQKYSEAHPDKYKELNRRFNSKLPEGWEQHLPKFDSLTEPMATRQASNKVLNSLAGLIPELIGGSADLTPSNLTRWDGAEDFQPNSEKDGGYAGRYIRFGVREHGMAGILNGVASYGGIIPFGASFLNFLMYGFGAVRLSALSYFRVIYIMTHDSIGLGEDGPTHQPIENLALLRATPNLYLQRPADGNETSAAYHCALTHLNSPTVLSLSRQKVPSIPTSSYEKALKGAYAVMDPKDPDVILVATGTEVSIALDAGKILREQGHSAKVISMPCFELFDEQSIEYQQSLFPKSLPVISCEALSTFGWSKYAHSSLGINTFGTSGDQKDVYEKLGITAPNLADLAGKTIAYYKRKGIEPPYLMETPDKTGL